MAKRLQKKRATPAHARVASNPTAFPFAPGTLASTWRAWLPQFLLIAGVTLWIYWPALRGGFVWDDAFYITGNPLLHDWGGLGKIWFQPGSGIEYYPVLETALWLQWHLFGNDTLGYHLTNLSLHVINALLVWRLLSKLGLRLAPLGGLIFAIHPVQVESVAWICELKNTLSLPFFLLGMCFWIDYEGSGRIQDYGSALGLFLVAMLAKISMASFPVIILLYAWWKRGRIAGKDWWASAPFFIISLVLGTLAIWVERHYGKMGHAQPNDASLGGFFSRLAGSGRILSFYFSRSFFPVGYLPSYPKWTVNPRSFLDDLPGLVAVGGFCWLWSRRQGWGRHALLGLGFFCFLLAPFLGFIWSGYMDFTWVMDHFLYMPMIGLIGLGVAALGDLEARLPSLRPYALGGLSVALALMAWESHAVAGLFVSDETLWSYTLRHDPNCWLARDNLGGDLLKDERFPEATSQYREALRLHPDYSDGRYNMGVALEKMGRDGEAQKEYREALSLNPANVKACLNLGELMKRNGNLAGAEALFRQGLKIAPDDASLCIDLGGILLQTGRVSEAIDLYEHAVEFTPDLAQLQYNLGVALLQAGSLSEAEEHLETAVTLDPRMVSAHENLGVVLARLGHLPEAIEQFEAAIQIDDGYLIARNNLGLALAQSGRIPEAIEQFQQVLHIDPNNAQARQSLAKLQQFEMQQNAPGK